MIAVVDYGVGNLFSLRSSLHYIGADTVVTRQPEEIRKADRIILPGVGAFADAVAKLRETGLFDLVRAEAVSGKPLLGICLGMQMLFERSFEYGEHLGLGLIPGNVKSIIPMIPSGYKVPHIGWNALHFPKERPVHALFQTISEGDCVYFVHSFAATDCDDAVIATAEYGAELTAAVAKDNVWGTQFHPEKSGAVGLKLLQSFCMQ